MTNKQLKIEDILVNLAAEIFADTYKGKNGEMLLQIAGSPTDKELYKIKRHYINKKIIEKYISKLINVF